MKVRWKDGTQKDFQETDIEIMILMKAINDTFSQTVYSRHSYKSEDIIEHAKFVPLRQEIKEDGRIVVSVNADPSVHKNGPSGVKGSFLMKSFVNDLWDIAENLGGREFPPIKSY